MEGMERGKRDGCGERGGELASTPQSVEGFHSVHCVLIRNSGRQSDRFTSLPLLIITPCSFAVSNFNILPFTSRSSRRVARV